MYCHTASGTPTNIYSSAIYQFFQGHLKKNVSKFSTQKYNFFKCSVVSNFGHWIFKMISWAGKYKRVEPTLDVDPVLCATASLTPTNIHSSDISQSFQEHLKKNIWKFSTQKINFFKYWVVSNFGPLDLENGLMDGKTQQYLPYPRCEACDMHTLPLQILQICIVARYLNIFKNIWKKIFENFLPKISNFFKCWVVSNFGQLDF